MVVAPEAIRGGFLHPVIGSNISFVQLLFVECDKSFVSLFIFSIIFIPFDGILEAHDLVGPLVCKGPLKVT
jgi:hypothetical protein